jgi:putative Mg2+ transporter-C (MgtC) family protein
MKVLDVSWVETLHHLLRLCIAYLLALPVAWNREREARGAGLRTFPLVAMASCGFMITGLYVLDTSDAESRVIYGIITGIGFIGGGAILKGHGSVAGTATAASIWNTGAIGVAVAFDRLEIAIPLAVLNVVTLRLGAYVKEKFPTDPDG